MRNVLGIVLYVVAGVFVYAIGLLAFIDEPVLGKKGMVMAILAVPLSIALGGGTALRRFRHWRADIGWVFIGGSGFTAFVAFTFACMLMEDDFRALLPSSTVKLFSDYVVGITAIIGIAGVGWWLVRRSSNYDDSSTR